MDEHEEFLLQEYAAGMLAAESEAAVAALLSRSAAARAYLAEMEALYAELDELPEEPLTTDLAAAVLAAITLEEELAPARFWWLLGMQSIALLLLAGLTFSRWWPVWESTVAALPAGWQTYLPRPEWRTLWTMLQNGWQTAVAGLPAPPLIELPAAAWGGLLALAFLLWLAGNRLLFTDAQNGGNSDG